MTRKTTGMISGIALACAMGTAASAQDFRFSMAIIAGENSVYYEDIARPFADLVAQMTDGRVEIDILTAGTVGSVLRLHEAVQDGLVDMAQTTPIFLGTADPVDAIIASFPTGLGVDSYLPWLYFAGGEELWREHRRERMGLEALVTGLGPSELFAHSNVPVRNADDLQGLRFRALGNWAAILQEFYGVSPTVVAGSEIYGMLERGGLDLAEFSTPNENLKVGFHEVARYIVYPGFHAPAWAFETVMLPETWEALPEDIQAQMELAAELVTYRSLGRMMVDDLDAMAEFESMGNEIIRLDEEFVHGAREKSREWARREAERASDGDYDLPLRLVDSVFSFQDHWRAHSYYMVTDTVNMQ